MIGYPDGLDYPLTSNPPSQKLLNSACWFWIILELSSRCSPYFWNYWTGKKGECLEDLWPLCAAIWLYELFFPIPRPTY